ncbi:hypothetical protein KBX17_01575 [Corynebacterium sp. CCUG 65737]|uniref:hypothetical protein n=1 Tax=Corynebacterium sp. CCUG 65737 TaxID=2823889 RepID=UPI00210CEC7C|nr:hypothetical protein [Corynebacterium sp. CCUG 65737]MCQ4626505.1 hypothetical protein [Corynebacterium sp. CCUG 65737]
MRRTYKEHPSLPDIYNRNDLAVLREELLLHDDPVLIPAAMEAIARRVNSPAEDEDLCTILGLDRFHAELSVSMGRYR